MVDYIVGAAVAESVTLIIIAVAAFVRKRVRVTGPNAEEITDLKETTIRLIAASDMMVKIQGPQLAALIALLESEDGQRNGNIKRALSTTRTAKEEYDRFLIGSAQISEALR